MEGCIFCDRAMMERQGILYEDEHCFAILDKYPISEGHTLVIPKGHFPNMLETPDAVIAPTFSAARKMALVIKDRLHAQGINITTNIGRAAGQVVYHFHVHVIPRYGSGKGPDSGFLFNHNEQIDEGIRGKLVEMLKTV